MKIKDLTVNDMVDIPLVVVSAIAKETKAKKPVAVDKAKATKEKAKPTAKAKATNAKPKTAKIEKIVLKDNSPKPKSGDTVKESKLTANGKFDVKKAKDGRFFFSFYSSNGAVIAYSQLYSSLSSVNTGINSIINHMDKAGIEDTTLKNPTVLPCPKWEIYIDKAEEYRFRLYASNGLCVCHSSHGYTTKSGCKGGIESIKRLAAEAKVNKTYLK